MLLTRFICLSLLCIFTTAASGDSLSINGDSSFNIKRSISGNWSASSGVTLAATITSGGMHRIIVETILINQPAWHDRYLKINLSNHADWQAISPLATFNEVLLVTGGVSSPSGELVRNLVTGNHPSITVVLESRADVSASVGPSAVTIRYTLLTQ